MFQITRPLRSIALCPRQELGPIRLVLLAKELGEEGGLELMVLKVFAGGRTYLAALIDQRDRVIEWLEIWVQCTQDLDTSPLSRSATFGNAAHDQQWRAAVESLREVSPATFLETGWESNLNSPLAIDLKRGIVVQLVHAASKMPLELCRDDAVLRTAGLGDYSATTERWFFARSSGGELSWLSLQDLLPRDPNERVAVPEGGEDSPVVDFNLGAGLMLLRKHLPVSIEGFLNWLSGAAASGEPALDGVDPATIEHQILSECGPGPGGVKLANGDSVLEGAFLRVQLWLTMARAVHVLSRRRRAPFLNLSTDSFRLALNAPPALLQKAPPFHVELVHPGDAVAIKIGESDAGFAPLRGSISTNHALPKFGGWLEGSGTLRIRQLSEAGEGQFRLEGVLDGNELRNVSAEGFVWVQTLVDGRSVSFYAKIDGDKGNTRAGTAFSAPSVDILPQSANRLKAAARQPCQYVIVRPVDPVFDIYSLGVIGVRIFLAADQSAMNEIVDDLFELAALLPQNETIDDLRRLAAAPELSDQLRQLLSPPVWCRGENGESLLAENVWYSILRQLIGFVAVEVPSAPEGASSGASTWLEVMRERLDALEQVSAQVERLLYAPRVDHDEVARIVHSFV